MIDIRLMDTSYLRYFQTIAEHTSLSKAARALHVSQPTLTNAIKTLEEEFEATLILRDSKGISLTSSGEALLSCIAEVFATLEHGKESIRGLEGGEAGRFVIGCHESLGSYFLPAFMRAFMDEAPKIEVSLWNGSSSETRQAVLDRRIHFGLVVNPVPHPDLVMVDLFKDGVEVFVAGSETECTTLQSAQVRIQDGPLIFAGRIPQCQELISRFAAQGILPTRMLDCGDLEQVKSLAIAGLGVALLPRRVASYNTDALRLLHSDLPTFPDTIFLLYRADMHRTRSALRLKDAIVAFGKGLDDV